MFATGRTEVSSECGSRPSTSSQEILVFREHFGESPQVFGRTQGGMLMALFVWLLEGSTVGWLSTLLVRDATQRRISRSVYAGMVGAFVSGLAWGLFVNSDVTISSLIASLIGAALALVLMKLSRRESLR